MTEPATELQIRIGAVAMVDALGFRGIWKRHVESTVLSKLEALADTTIDEATDLQSSARGYGGNILEFVKPSFLSDTIVFGVGTKPLDVVSSGMSDVGLNNIVQFDDDSLAGEALRISAELLGEILRRALEDPVPLAYRGAIAFGRFGMTDRFVVGPAVDEAAAWMNRAQGAFVILAPSAEKYPQAATPSAISNLLRYKVPMHPDRHNANTLDTLVLCPFAGIEDAELRDKLAANLVASFGASPQGDVAEKLANTKAFLAAAKAAERAPLEELLAHALRP